MPRSVLRTDASTLPLWNTRVVTIAAVSRRWSSVVSPTWALVVPTSRVASTVNTSGLRELIVILDRIGVKTARLGTGATHVRVGIGVAGFSIPFIVFLLIEIFTTEYRIIASVNIVAHGDRMFYMRICVVYTAESVVVISIVVREAIVMAVNHRATFVLVFLSFVIVMIEALRETGYRRWIGLRWKGGVSSTLLHIRVSSHVVRRLSSPRCWWGTETVACSDRWCRWTLRIARSRTVQVILNVPLA